MSKEFGQRLVGRFQNQVGLERAIAIRDAADENLGEPRRISNLIVMFIDVRGSKDLQNKLPAETFAEFMRSLIGDIRSAILDAHGMMDKLLGDGAMALFSAQRLIPGDPIGFDAPDDAKLRNARRQTLKCAESIIKKFQAKRRHGAAYDQLVGHYGLPVKLGLGMGIVEGEALVGSFGPKQGRDGTPIPPELSVFAMKPNIPAIANDLCDLARFDKFNYVFEACKKFLAGQGDAEFRNGFRGATADEREAIARQFVDQDWNMIVDKVSPNSTILVDVTGRESEWDNSIVPEGASLLQFPCRCGLKKLKENRSVAALLVPEDS